MCARSRARLLAVAVALLACWSSLGEVAAAASGAQQKQHLVSSSRQQQQHQGLAYVECLAGSLLSWASGRGFTQCANGGDDLEPAGDAQSSPEHANSRRWTVLSPLSAVPERALDDAGVAPDSQKHALGQEVDAVSTVFEAASASAYMPALAYAVPLSSASTSTSHQQDKQRLRDAAGDGSPGSFNLEQSTRMGRITSMAYCSQESIQAWNCTRCLRVPGFASYEVVFDQQWDLQAYTGYDAAQDAVVVAFRGTDSHSWGNWINNLKTWHANKMYPVEGHPGALVHAGFYDLWVKSSLQRNLTRAVGEIVAAHPTPRLFLTGHSMGGALSSLAALDLKFVHNFTEVRTWTFGSPRVGNFAWEGLFQEHVVESWRFTHNRDIVPSLPPRLLGFHHVPREAWLVDFAGPAGIVEEKVLICDGTGEDPSCHNSACMLGLCTSVADHLTYLGLEMYRDAMEC